MKLMTVRSIMAYRGQQCDEYIPWYGSERKRNLTTQQDEARPHVGTKQPQVGAAAPELNIHSMAVLESISRNLNSRVRN
jgi:hypothetical protein